MDSLTKTIEHVGVTSDMWKTVIRRAIQTDKSPEVRIAASHCLVKYLEASLSLSSSQADNILNVLLKVVLSSGDQLREQGFVGPNLLEMRYAHVNAMVALFRCQSKFNMMGAVSAVSAAVGVLSPFLKKYKHCSYAVDSICTVLVRLGVTNVSSPIDLLNLSNLCIDEISLYSTAISSRMIREIVRTRGGVSQTVSYFSEVWTVRELTNLSENQTLVLLSFLDETLAVVGTFIEATHSFTVLSNQLLSLVGLPASSSALVAECGNVLKRLSVLYPSRSFSLVNVLLNYVTVAHAECEQQGSQQSLLNHCRCMGVVVGELFASYSEDYPEDMVSAVISTAVNLIDAVGDDSSNVFSHVRLQKKLSGFILLGSILGAVNVKSILPIIGCWKSVLGKATKDAFMDQKFVNDQNRELYLEVVLFALLSISECLRKNYSCMQIDARKIILLFLNNAWQIVQSADLRKIKCALFKSIRMYSADDLQASFAKPLALWVVQDIVKSAVSIGFSPVDAGADSASLLEDLADPILHADWKHALGCSVEFAQKILTTNNSILISDFYSSTLAAGSFAEWSDMKTVNDSAIEATQLLVHLVKTSLLDEQTLDSCVAILLVAYGSVSQPSSAAFEQYLATPQKSGKFSPLDPSANNYSSIHCAPVVVSVSAVLIALFSDPLSSACVTPTSVSSVITLMTSATGLGALHPFTRRCAAGVVSKIFASRPETRSTILQSLVDACTGSVMRTRSAAASVCRRIIEQFPEEGLALFGKQIINLARDPALPLRVTALLGVRDILEIKETSFAGEAMKLVQTQMEGDPVSAGIVEYVLNLVWEGNSFRENSSSFWKIGMDSVQVQVSHDTEYLVQRTAGNELHCIASKAVERLVELVRENRSIVSKSLTYDFVFGLIDRGLVFEEHVLLHAAGSSDQQDCLVNLLKALSRQGSGGGAAFKVHKQTIEAAAEELLDDSGSRPPTVDLGTVSHTSLSTKSRVLGLQRLEKILRENFEFACKNFASMLDQILPVAVNASLDSASAALALAGVSVVAVVVEIWGPSIGSADHILGPFETQIVMLLRRAARETAPVQDQVIAFKTIENLIKHNVFPNAASTLRHMLTGPIDGLADVASSAPWSTYADIRLRLESSRGNSKSDREISIGLFERMIAVSRVLEDLWHRDSVAIESMFGTSSVGYYFLRLLVDMVKLDACKNNYFFSIPNARALPTLTEYVERSVLPVAVLSGLSVLHLAGLENLNCPPPDFPMDINIAEFFASLTTAQLDTVQRSASVLSLFDAVEVCAFQFGHIQLINSFRELLMGYLDNVISESPSASLSWSCLHIALRLVDFHPEYATDNSALVWALVSVVLRAAQSPDSQFEKTAHVTRWSFANSGSSMFDDSERIRYVLNYFDSMMAHLPPHRVAKEWRGVVQAIPAGHTKDMAKLGVVCVQNWQKSGFNQKSVILTVPVWVLLVSVSEALDWTLHVKAFTEAVDVGGCTTVVTILTKLLQVENISAHALKELVIPMAAKLIKIDAKSASALLPLIVPVFERLSEDRIFLVRFILLTAVEISKSGKKEIPPEVSTALLSVLRPADVFKSCFAELPEENRSVIEKLIRQSMAGPAKPDIAVDETSTESQQTKRIQLKLDFAQL